VVNMHTYICIYALSNNAFNISYSTTINSRLINEGRIKKNVKGSCHDLNSGTSLEFALND
jgi:hypothetical protein